MTDRQRWLIFFVSILALAFSLSQIVINHGYADPFTDKVDNSTLPIMSPQERQALFSQLQLSQTPAGTNYEFSLIITPTGIKETNVVVSPENVTALQNNVAFFTACGVIDNGLCKPPIPVTLPPTQNYCPLAKMILTNQDGYLPKLYNVTAGKDLTGYVYPSYCYSETGPNPINGQGTVPVSSNISIVTDKPVYSLGDSIILSGQTTSSTDVSIIVRSPNGNFISAYQIHPSNGMFSQVINTGGTLWQQTGTYSIKAQQSDSLIANTTFNLTSAIPEFPWLILAIVGISFGGMLMISKYFPYGSLFDGRFQ